MMAVINESHRSTVKFADLEMAFSFISDAYAYESAAFISRKTGKIYWESSELGPEFEVPDDVSDSDLYAPVPDKGDLDLGVRLVFQFVRRQLPTHHDRVSSIFRRRGAYGRFKDFLHDQGRLEEWYDYENSATEAALRAWAEEEGFTVLPVPTQEKPRRIYQFKVELQEIEPPIWRRIQVPETYNFWGLHVVVQDSMGWLDYHLHAFRVTDKDKNAVRIIGIPDDDFPLASPTLPGWEIALADYFSEVGAFAEYEYDFGDGWLHNVILEGVLLSDPDQQYPRCTDGERACPPEDCGGAPGYCRLLDSLSGSENVELEEPSNWLGQNFDPEKFSPHEIEIDDPKARWESAFLK